MKSGLPSQIDSPDLVVMLPDGRRAVVTDGEFRSLDGKLLFVRRGDRLEIRCPRSKALYTLEWETARSTDFDQGQAGGGSSPPR